MRTMLDIADDVLIAAKEAARRQKASLGSVISDLARRALTAPTPNKGASTTRSRSALSRLGVRPAPKRGGIVSNETINQLRDDGIY
jgi:hypothetical protein